MPDLQAPDRVTPELKSARFLTGDMIKVCIAEIRQQQVPFSMLPEKEQQKIIDRVTDACTRAGHQAARIIAGLGRPTVEAEIESVTFKDGIKVVLTMSKMQADRHAIADATGDSVLLVLPSYAEIVGGDVPKADPDQPRLDGIDERPAHGGGG